ncbi:uroplakin-3b [Puntigrus tetrazona]|uniref:uroplakin-3b n=1 Tax=Puntigrus tetrazona TaxID=1606681 RepID=UPI001C8AB08A|nr:uroplakin-3b [Puntigrus tetrazona]
MKTDAALRLMSLMSIWMWTSEGQIFQPVLTSNAFLAKVTSNTVILSQPYCVFNQPCPGCVIWLVAGLCSANANFDALANSSASSILSLSPYPSAFLPSSYNFFVTRVGYLADFPCSQYPGSSYFVVGADGLCSTVNCNGVLPSGSTVCFKYLLIDANGTLVNSSYWSGNTTLIQLQPLSNIYDGLSARSGAMVVITTLLCVAAALLLLLFLCMLCVTCCTKKDGKQVSVMNSIRIPRYDTHNLKERAHPYDNPSYQADSKNYSTSSTLPKDGARKL